MIKSTSVSPAMVPQPPVSHRSRRTAAKHKDFLDSFRPIYYFSRSFGLMPFSIGRSSSGNILGPRVHKFDAVWFVATILIYALATVVSFKYVKFKQESNTQLNMLVISNNWHLTSGLLFCVVIIGMDLYNRDKLVDLIKRFTVFDKQVSVSCSAWISINFTAIFLISNIICLNIQIRH